MKVFTSSTDSLSRFTSSASKILHRRAMAWFSSAPEAKWFSSTIVVDVTSRTRLSDASASLRMSLVVFPMCASDGIGTSLGFELVSSVMLRTENPNRVFWDQDVSLHAARNDNWKAFAWLQTIHITKASLDIIFETLRLRILSWWDKSFAPARRKT